MDGSTDTLRRLAEEARTRYGSPPNTEQAEMDSPAQQHDRLDTEEFPHQADISPAKPIAVPLKMQLRITNVVPFPAQTAPIGVGGGSAVMIVDATTATPFDQHRFKDMPKFSGDPLDWSEFMAQFEESVIKTDLETVYRFSKTRQSILLDICLLDEKFLQYRTSRTSGPVSHIPPVSCLAGIYSELVPLPQASGGHLLSRLSHSAIEGRYSLGLLVFDSSI